MRSWMNSELINRLPEEMKSKIVAVDKLTNSVGFTADPASVTSTSDKLWLLSQSEILGPSDGSNPSYFGAIDPEGSQYQLYLDASVGRSGGSPLLEKIDAQESGISAVVWWQRSAAADSAESFFFTNEHGEGYFGGNAASSQGVVPGFSL